MVYDPGFNHYRQGDYYQCAARVDGRGKSVGICSRGTLGKGQNGSSNDCDRVPIDCGTRRSLLLVGVRLSAYIRCGDFDSLVHGQVFDRGLALSAERFDGNV